MRRLALIVLLAALLVGTSLAADPPAPPVLNWPPVATADGKSVVQTPDGAGKYNIVMVNGAPAFLWVDPATGMPWFYSIGGKITLTPPGPGPIPPPPPVLMIESFTATPEIVQRGQPSILAWKAGRAKSVTLNSVPVATTGQQVVEPSVTTTYTLTAVDGPTTETAQRIVIVTDTPPPTKLGVLIVEEKTDRGKLPKGQVEILTSTASGSVIDYMMKHCAKGPDGKTPEYRIVDKDVSFAQESPQWQKIRKAFDDLKLPVPGWIVGGGSGEAPGSALPSDPATALEVLKKFTPPGGKP